MTYRIVEVNLRSSEPAKVVLAGCTHHDGMLEILRLRKARQERGIWDKVHALVEAPYVEA